MLTLRRGPRQVQKLTLEQATEIRRLYEEGYTQVSLGKYFGVSTNTIGRIVRWESWQDGKASEQWRKNFEGAAG